jgi:hypothetical protein
MDRTGTKRTGTRKTAAAHLATEWLLRNVRQATWLYRKANGSAALQKASLRVIPGFCVDKVSTLTRSRILLQSLHGFCPMFFPLFAG